MVYKTFTDIPNESELRRMYTLCATARAKVSDKPWALTDDDFQVLECVGHGGEAVAARQACGTARLEQFKAESRAAEPAPPTSAVRYAQLVLPTKDDSLDGWMHKNWDCATPLMVAKHLFDAVQDSTAKIAALEAKITAIERRPLSAGVKWMGIHERGRHYSEGNLITRDGSVWVATCDTSETPGVGETNWRLIVKGDRRSEPK